MSVPDPYLLAVAELAGKLASLFSMLRSEKVRRNKVAANYFTNLAATMKRVFDALEARQIPRIDGHELEMLLRAFPDKTKGILSKTISNELKMALNGVAEIARTLDAHYILHQPEIEANRREMLKMLECMVGDLRGLAGKLDPGTGL